MQEIFNKQVLVRIDPGKIQLAREFASAVTATVNYSDSNQTFKSRIEYDHFISKLGEEAAAAVFKQHGAEVEGPDYTIYLGDYKSWDADLKVNGIDVAVKTQTSSSAGKYGLSWTFQSSGYRRDTILDLPDAWIVFVKCDDESDFQCTVFPPKRMKELKLEDPVLSHLKGKKLVYYHQGNDSTY